MARRAFRTRARGPKRKLTWEWAGLFGQFVGLTENDVVSTWVRVPAGYVDTANSAGIPVQIEPDATLIRTRLLWTFSTDNAGVQVTYPFAVCCGLIAWDGTTDDTNDIGLLPHPYYDQELDWIFRSDGPENQQNIIRGGNGGGDVDAYQSKAMRKLSNGTGLLWVMAIGDPLGGLGGLNMNVAMNCRNLYKLP